MTKDKSTTQEIPRVWGALCQDQRTKNKCISCYHTTKNINLDHYLTSHTKIYSKWIKNPNMCAKNIKYLEENIGINLYDLALGNSFS